MKINSPSLPNRTIAVSVTLYKSHPQHLLVADARFLAALCFSILILFAGGCKKKPVPAPPPEVQVITLTATNVLIDKGTRRIELKPPWGLAVR